MRRDSLESLRVMVAALSARCIMTAKVPGNQACACRSSSLTDGVWQHSAVGLLPQTPPPATMATELSDNTLKMSSMPQGIKKFQKHASELSSWEPVGQKRISP